MPAPLARRAWAAALVVAATAAPAAKAELAEDRAPPARATVSLRGRPLFDVQAPTGRLPVPDRAARIQARLEAALRAGRAGAEVRLQARGGDVDVYAGPDFVFTVWEGDAAHAGLPLQVLAEERAGALRAAIDAAREETQPRSLLQAAARVAAATLALALLLVAGRALLRRLRLRAARLALGRLRLLRRRGLPGLSSLRLGRLLRGGLRLSGVVGALAASVAWLDYVLSQIPWTRGAARAAFEFALEAVGGVLGGIVGYLPKAFYVLLIVLVTRWALRLVRAGFRELGSGRVSIAGFHPDWARPTYKLVRLLAVALAAVAIFPYLPGAGSPAFQSVSIFLGVLVSLGSSAAVANAIGGVILTFMRPFVVGDRIRSGEVEGVVLDTGLLAVRLRTELNEEVTLPNSTVLGGHVRNFSAQARGAGLIVHTSVTIGYGVPWRQVHELLVAAATGCEGLEADPTPFVWQTGLDDFYVRYQLNAACRRPDRLRAVLARLHERIQDEFARAGVEIMSPHVTALRDGHELAFPAEHHPAGAVPGRLRVDAAVTRDLQPGGTP